MSPTTVSVIIPVYNGERFLSEALESVAWQTLPPLEMIVVDDGSTDCSAQVARCFPGVTYIRQENQGVSAARNVGVGAAHGSLIAFLDHDDIWAPDKLGVQVAALAAAPAAGYASCRLRAFVEGGGSVPSWYRAEALDREAPGRLPSCLCVRREVFDAVGAFNEAFRVAEDIEWLGRAADAGIASVLVPEVLVLRRIHDTNLSGQVAANHQAMLDGLRASVRRRRAAPGGERT